MSRSREAGRKKLLKKNRARTRDLRIFLVRQNLVSWMINELKTGGTNGKSSIQLLNIKPKPKRRIPPLQGKRSRVWKATKTEHFRQIRMSNQINPVALDVHNKQWNHSHSSAENEVVRWEKRKHTELKVTLPRNWQCNPPLPLLILFLALSYLS